MADETDMKLKESRLRDIIREELFRLTEIGMSEDVLRAAARRLEDRGMSARLGDRDVIFVETREGIRLRAEVSFLPGGPGYKAKQHVVVETEDGKFIGKGGVPSQSEGKDIGDKIAKIIKANT